MLLSVQTIAQHLSTTKNIQFKCGLQYTLYVSLNGLFLEKNLPPMFDENIPELKFFYSRLKDGSIVTNTSGKPHTVKKQVRTLYGSWRLSFEISNEQPITLFPLQENERYLIICEGIFEFVHY